MEPLLVTLSAGVTQFVVARLVFICGWKPVEGEGQWIRAVFVDVSAIFNPGTPNV